MQKLRQKLVSFTLLCALSYSVLAQSAVPPSTSAYDEIKLLLEKNSYMEAQQQGSQSLSATSDTCPPAPLPSSPTGPSYSMEYERFSARADMTFWREPCVDGTDETAVLVRVIPSTGSIFLCGPGFYVQQSDNIFDNVRFETQAGGSSFCANVSNPATFIVNQWTFFENYDEQETFEFFQESSGNSVVIAAANTNPTIPLNAYNVPNSIGGDQITIHLVNSGQTTASVIGTLYHQDGYVLGVEGATVTESLPPGARMALSAKDLEEIFQTVPWTKRSRIELLTSSKEVDLLATVRTTNGTTTNLTCTNNRYAHNVPNSVNVDQAFIRVSNVTDYPIEVRGTLYHQDGFVLGQPDSVLISSLPAKATQVLTAADLEDLVGTSAWTRRARLEITSNNEEVAIMGLIRTSNVLTNMSCSSSSAVPNIPSDENSDSAFVRVTNTSDAPVDVRAELIDQNGSLLRPEQRIDIIDAQQTKVYSAQAIADIFNVDTWSRRARFNIVGQTSRLSILNLIRSPSDILTNMSCTNDGSAYYIPNIHSVDQAFIRISNRSEAPVRITGTMFDETGAILGKPSFVIDESVQGNETIVVNAESLAQLSGIGTWNGLARLEIDEPSSDIELLNLLRNANGTLTNLSCSAKKFGLSRVSGTVTSQRGLYQDSDTNNPDATAQSNDTVSTAQILDNPFIVQGHANVAGAGEQGQTQQDGDIDDLYFSNFVANQVIQLETAESDKGTFSLFLADVDRNIIDGDVSSNAIKTLTVPDNGGYYVLVKAVSGASNYILSVLDNTLFASSDGLRLSSEFVIGDMIVKQKTQEMLMAMDIDDTLSTNRQIVRTSRGTINGAALYSAGNNTTQIKTSLDSLSIATREVSQIDEIERLFNFSEEQVAKLATLLTINVLNQRPDVEYAEPNYISRLSAVPNDPYYANQWHYPAINLPRAWDITTGSEEVIVAVIDSGVDMDHPDLVDNLIGGYDFIRDIFNSGDGDGIDPNPNDPGQPQGGGVSSHGTHVAGTVAAATNNQTGVAGVAWNTKIMPVRVLGQNRGGTTWDIINGVSYAAGLPNDSGTLPARRADIINASYEGFVPNAFEIEAYAKAQAQGVIIIAAAGNGKNNIPSYPASYPGVISVSAIDEQGGLALYSSFGRFVDIAAPGGDEALDGGVYSTNISGTVSNDRVVLSTRPTYNGINGTSMASPHVAGVVALMKSVYPELTPDDVNNAIASGRITRDIGEPGRDDSFGHGLIDALLAVQEAQRLAGGNASDIPPFAVASVSGVNFGSVLDSYTLLISNSGNGTLNVTGFEATDPSWIRFTEVEVDDNGLGRYRFSVIRTGLPPGVYQSDVFVRTTANDITMRFVMIVPSVTTERNPGLQYVILIDAKTRETVQSKAVEADNGQYHFNFESVPRGEYFLLIGTDADNDFFVCDDGEACGAFPTLALPSLIKVDRDIQELRFDTGVQLALPSAVSAVPDKRSQTVLPLIRH